MNDSTVIGDVNVTMQDIPDVRNGVALHLEGQLNTYNSTQFQAYSHDLVTKGYRNFFMECGALNYVSSTGVGSFTFILKELRPYGGNIVICGMQQKVKDIFQLLGFSNFFDFSENIREAANKMNGFFDPSPPPKVKETLEVLFPLIVQCPECRKKYKVSKAGKYRCAVCHKAFTVASNGQIYI